jgi:hypothetical protein
MIRVYCEFQDCTEDDLYRILYVDGSPLADVAEQFGLKEGDRVLLCQDDFDAEVEATVHFGCSHPYFIGAKLCVRPDWRTRRNIR